jgi:spore maturation protein CgeB
MINLLIISSVYEGYLDQFHRSDSRNNDLSYNDLYEKLIADSTEFVASYIRTFIKKGVKANAIIANYSILQKKWIDEYGGSKNENLLFEQVKYYSPDIVLVEDLRFVDEIFLSQLKQKFPFVKLLIANHCAPVMPGSFCKFSYFDFILTCTPGLKQQFESEGMRSYLVYHGFDADLNAGIYLNEYKKTDVLFTGTLKQGKGYHLERIKLLDYLLNRGIKISLFINLEKRSVLRIKKILRIFYRSIKAFGFSKPEKISYMLSYGAEPLISYPASILKEARKPVYGKEMLNVLANSKIVLNNHGEIAGKFAGNMRLFEATGAGACLLTDNKCNLHKLFKPGIEIVTYDNNEDCLNKIKWLLENENERRKIAEAGQKRTLKDHTVSSRCSQILEIMKKELNNQNTGCEQKS